MINKTVALTLKNGQVLHHINYKNKDGTPLRCRVNGQCMTWVTRPAEFKMPVMRGLYDHFYVTHDNGHLWALNETAAIVEGP